MAAFLIITVSFAVIQAGSVTKNLELVTAVQELSCTEGWYPLGNLCYQGFEERLTFDDAEKECVKLGGHLAAITSEAIQEYVLFYILLGFKDYGYIGLRLPEDGSNAMWTDGSPMKFVNWDVGQPDRRLEGGQVESCIEMRFEAILDRLGKWNDITCHDKRPYVCQKIKTTVPDGETAATDPTVCPGWSGGFRFGDSCYHLSSHRKSWQEAEKYCTEQYNGHLVAVKDFFSQTFLHYLTKTAGKSDRLWIGIRLMPDEISLWSSGWYIVFTNWRNSSTHWKVESESCGSIMKSNGQWEIGTCEEILSFICEETSVVPPPRLTTTKTGAKCPNNENEWIDVGGNYCYIFQEENLLPWDNANFYCLTKGGTLASIHSEAEVDVLKQFITMPYTALYIGLFRDNQSEFQWADKSPVDYTRWDSGEPNNKAEECSEISKWREMKWNDIYCDGAKGFICSAAKVSSSNESGQKTPEEKSGGTITDLLKIAFTIVGLVGAATAVSLYFLAKFYRYKKMMSQRRWLNAKNLGREVNPNIPLKEQADLLPPYDEKWEFPQARLKFGKTLGKGAFGKVVKATATGIICKDESKTTVAVKTLKDRTDLKQQKALMTELKILIYIGHHTNIVNLIGAVTRNSKRMMVIVEYCRHGNLREYLLRNRKRFVPPKDSSLKKKKKKNVREGDEVSSNTSASSDSDTERYNEPAFIQVPMSSEKPSPSFKVRKNRIQDSLEKIPPKPGGYDSYDSESSDSDTSELSNADRRKKRRPIRIIHLIIYAFQCAKGMQYLASKKVIHRDLAARNVLLADNDIVKICDFGLAKDIKYTHVYQYTPQKRDDLLPMKWMAIESIADRIFSTKSDVWSFGVLLWEIFTLGGNPYPCIPVDGEFLKQLKDGYRMEKPKNAPETIYKIMTDCWNSDPEDRPDFRKLSTLLGGLISSQTPRVYVDHNLSYQMEGQMNLPDKNEKENRSAHSSHTENRVDSLNACITEDNNVDSPFQTDSDGNDMSTFADSTVDTSECNSTGVCAILEV